MDLNTCLPCCFLKGFFIEDLNYSGSIHNYLWHYASSSELNYEILDKIFENMTNKIQYMIYENTIYELQ